MRLRGDWRRCVPAFALAAAGIAHPGSVGAGSALEIDLEAAAVRTKVLVAGFPDAEVLSHGRVDPADLDVSLGPIVRRRHPIGDSEFRTLDVTSFPGAVTRFHYRLTSEGGVSTVEVVDYYAAELEKAGFKQLLRASGDDPMSPGGTAWSERVYAGLPEDLLDALMYTSDRNRRRYLVAERLDLAGRVVAVLMVNVRRTGEIRVQFDTVEVDADLMRDRYPSAGAVTGALAAHGRWVPEAVRFTAGGVPSDASFGALSSLADALKSDPDLRVYVVGHASEQNVEAAEDDDVASMTADERGDARARNTVAVLVEDLGVDRERLVARSAGALVPRAGPSSDRPGANDYLSIAVAGAGAE